MGIVLQVHFALHLTGVQLDLPVPVRREFGTLLLAEAESSRAASLLARFLCNAVSFSGSRLGVPLGSEALLTRVRSLGPDGGILLGLGAANRRRWFPTRGPVDPTSCFSRRFGLSSIANPVLLTSDPNIRPHPRSGAPSSPVLGGTLGSQRCDGGADDRLGAGGAVLVHVVGQRVQVAADGDVVQLVVGVLQAAPGAPPGRVAQAVLAAGQAAAATRQGAALLHQPLDRLNALVDGQQLLQELHVH